jgi:uncharacterized protein
MPASVTCVIRPGDLRHSCAGRGKFTLVLMNENASSAPDELFESRVDAHAAIGTEARSGDDDPDVYQHALHGRDPHRWRGVLTVVVLAVTFAVMTFVTSVLAVRLGLVLGMITEEQVSSGRIPFGPLILLSTNLSLASLIPASLFVQRVVYGQRIRLLHAVRGGFRWRLLPRAAVLVVPVWLAYLALSSLLDFPGSEYSGGVSVALLLVVVLTTPLQAAGEEYAFRGVLGRAVGAWFRSSRVAVVVSTIVASLLFMGSHASTDPWLNVYYFLFGVGMSVITWRTGGLETAVLVHVVNNTLIFGVVALFNDGVASTDRSAGTGSAFALVPIAAVAVVTVVVWIRTRRTRAAGDEVDAESPTAG